MTRDVSPFRVVVRFFVELAALRGALLEALGDHDDLLALVHAVKQGTASRSGSTDGGLRYEVHGVGCRVSATDGPEVDVDLDVLGDGRERVDVWRLQRFGVAAGLGDVGEDELRDACARLVELGVLEQVDGWWKLA